MPLGILYRCSTFTGTTILFHWCPMVAYINERAHFAFIVLWFERKLLRRDFCINNFFRFLQCMVGFIPIKLHNLIIQIVIIFTDSTIQTVFEFVECTIVAHLRIVLWL